MKVVSMCKFVYHMCAVSSEAREGGHQIPWT